MQTQLQPTIGKADLKTFDTGFLQVLGAVYSGDTFILLFVSKKLNRGYTYNGTLPERGYGPSSTRCRGERTHETVGHIPIG